MTRPRYVVRPCDNLGSVEGLKRDRTWDVVDRESDTVVRTTSTRADARAEAARRNANPGTDK